MQNTPTTKDQEMLENITKNEALKIARAIMSLEQKNTVINTHDENGNIAASVTVGEILDEVINR